MKKAAYAISGLSEYDPCWTGEMTRRPIPFVSTDPKPLITQACFEKYMPYLLDVLLPLIEPAIQSINKVSSLGFPVFKNHGDGTNSKGERVGPTKFDYILYLFQELQRSDYSRYDDQVNTIGLRKQNESPNKLREFQFINEKGEIYQAEINAVAREIHVPMLGTMIGSRSRTIVRPSVVNLWLQCWDTLLHNAIIKHPLFDSNVYNDTVWPTDSNFVTFDCKHYERYMGLCALSYARIIGGEYGEQLDRMIRAPFIVPSDTWKAYFEVTPQYRPGVYPQFSSGLSPVAPLGKLTNLAVQTAYFVEMKGYDPRSAVQVVLSGRSENLQRWSYGDDNRLLGTNKEIKDVCSFMSRFLEIEVEEQPTYLGTIFRRDLGRWVLPTKTYNLKLYQPERDYDWKSYPNLGLVERRATFTKYGEPEIGATIIPYEDRLWDAVGRPFIEIASAAVAERVAANSKGVVLSKYLVSDKEYLMTEQEKVASGQYWHLKPNVTASIVNQIVGKSIRDRLKFRDLPHESVPQPEKSTQSAPLWSQNNENDEIEDGQFTAG
jgi:hypothetical protein